MTRPLVVSASGDRPWARMAAEALAGGAIVAHPTETLYGLAVDPWSGPATAALARLKGRAAAAGLILLARGAEEAEALLAEPLPEHFRALARRFWPGPLTLVAPPAPGIPRGVLGPEGGLAVRVTPDPVAAEILGAAGRPLTSTSANRRGEPPARTARDVARSLGAAVGLIVDGGPRRGASPSTVVDLSGAEPVLLREGAVPAESLRRALGPGVPWRVR